VPERRLVAAVAAGSPPGVHRLQGQCHCFQRLAVPQEPEDGLARQKHLDCLEEAAQVAQAAQALP